MGLISDFKEAIGQVKEVRKDRENFIITYFREGYIFGFLEGSKFTLTKKVENGELEEGIESNSNSEQIKEEMSTELKENMINDITKERIKREIIDERIKTTDKKDYYDKRMKLEMDPGIDIKAEIKARMETNMAPDYSYHIGSKTEKQIQKRFKENKKNLSFRNARKVGKKLGQKDGREFYEKNN